MKEANTDFPFSPEIAANFERILNLEEGQAEHIIKYFKNDYEHGIKPVNIPNALVPPGVTLENIPPTSIYPLSDFISRSFLPGVDFEYRGGRALFNGNPITQIGSGSYGNIFQDEDGLIYKETQLEIYKGDNVEKVCEKFYRNFLLEVFIQVVLQNENPGAVGKINGVYIDNRINKRKSIRSESPKTVLPNQENNEATPIMVYSFFITMDNIPYTFDKYAREFRKFKNSRTSPKMKISLIEAKRIFIKLAENLKGFKQVGFKHGDLHMGNIMFNYEGDPIIIDLGMACLEVGGHVYSVNKNECQSYDLLMLMASLYESSKDIFEPNAFEAIGDCMKSNNESIYTAAARMGHDSVFHAFYYDKIKGDKNIIKKIPPRLRNDIDSFITYWETYKPPSFTRRLLKCVGMNCFTPQEELNRNSNSRKRKTRKSRKAP